MSGPRIVVVGAGAVGSVVAARLADAGHDVTLIARGERAAALRRDGLRIAGEPTRHLPVRSAAALPPSDILFTAIKEGSLRPLLDEVGSALSESTTLIPLVNGVPFWFAGPAVTRAAVVGAAVYITAALDEDGIVRPIGSGRLILGDTDSAAGGRAAAVASLLTAAGLETRLSDDVRAECWSKIALNLATNPLSVVTGATLADQFRDPALVPTVTAMLREAIAVARAHGSEPSMDLETMMATGRAAGPFRPSMLQDYEAGRSLELEAIASRCIAMGRAKGVAMPVSIAVAGVATFLERARPGPP